MKVHEETVAERDAMVESLAAELAVPRLIKLALRHRPNAAWVDLELDLWRTLTQAIKTWESTGRSQNLQPAPLTERPEKQLGPTNQTNLTNPIRVFFIR